MKTRIRKVLILTTFIFLFISLFGCNEKALKKKKKQSGDSLTIMCFKGGYGTDYLVEMAKAFEVMYGIDVDIEYTVIPSSITSQVYAGVYTADLVHSTTNMSYAGMQNFVLDITDVVKSTPNEFETKTIEEKLGSLASTYNIDGKYYQIPHDVGRTGLFYNETSLNQIFKNGYELPVTTNELIEFCDEIVINGGWPFVHTTSSEAEYYLWAYEQFAIQYMGYENYKNYFSISYIDENGEIKEAKTARELNNAWHKARLSSAEVLSKLVNIENGYCPKSVKTMDFMKAQAYFWGVTSQSDYKPTAFMVNGDWLYNEISYLKSAKDSTIKMMRMPINSAIIDKLETVDTEEKLRESIRYIDTVLEGTEGTRPSYLSEKDYERLLETRKMIYTVSDKQTMYIPSTCKNVEAAKAFLKFYCSEEASKIYSRNLQGFSSPYDSSIYVEASMNEFSKSVTNISKNSLYVCEVDTDYVLIGGLVFNKYIYFTTDLTNGVEPSNFVSYLEDYMIKNWDNIITTTKESRK